MFFFRTYPLIYLLDTAFTVNSASLFSSILLIDSRFQYNNNNRNDIPTLHRIVSAWQTKNEKEMFFFLPLVDKITIAKLFYRVKERTDNHTA